MFEFQFDYRLYNGGKCQIIENNKKIETCWNVVNIIFICQLLEIILTVWSMRRQRAIDNLVVSSDITMQVATTLLIEVANDVHISTVGGAVTAQAGAHATGGDVLIAFGILRSTRYRHLL